MATTSKRALEGGQNAPGDRLTAAAVVERLKEALGVSSDTALAEALHTSKQNVSKWKARNAVPYAEAVMISVARSVSLDYLLTGSKAASEVFFQQPYTLDPDIIRAALREAQALGSISVARSDDQEEEDAFRVAANGLVFSYAHIEEVIRTLIAKQKLTPEDAKAAAVLAVERLAEPTDGFVRKSRRSP